MSYLSSEQSVAAGQPVELYHLADDMGTNCRITSAGYDITYGSYLYTSEPCQRSELRITDSHEKNNMTLKLSRDNSFAQRYIAGPIEGIATLTIYRGHGTDFVTWWYGVIKQVAFDKDGVPTIICAPRTSSISRVGRRRVCQRLCDHALYDSGCQLNDQAYKITGTIGSVSGLVVASGDFPISPTYSQRGDITGLAGCVYNASGYMNYATMPEEAFDDQLPPNNYWASSTYPNQWVSCQWTSGKIIRAVKIQPCHAIGWSQFNPRHIKIEGSNNGSTWTKVPIVSWISKCSVYNTDEAELDQIDNHTEWSFFRLSNSTSYTYYRVYCSDNWGGGGGNFIAISEIEMHEYDGVTCSTLQGGKFVSGGAKRLIQTHTANQITLSRLIPGLVAGMSFEAYAGCDHSPETCLTVFNNKINNGGDEFLPTKNLFDGNAMASPFTITV